MPDYYSENRRLTDEEMHTNARFFYGLLSAGGWTLNAICGLFGNAQVESRLNPGAWQDYDDSNPDADDKGFGFVQWTPARDYIAWCNANRYPKGAPTTVSNRFDYEAENGLQYYATKLYPEPSTFYNFMRSSLQPDYLAKAFLYNYERPQTPDPERRARNALYWWEYLGGIPIPTPKSKWWMYLKRRTIL